MGFEQIRICKECGKEFIATSPRQFYCKNKHYRPCPICGMPVEVKYGHWQDSARTCSTKCRIQLKDRTCLEKYGTVDAGNCSEAKEKRKQTNLERYGVENPFQAEEFKQKSKNTLMEKYGSENISQTKENKEKIQHIWKEKTKDEIDIINNKRKQTSIEHYGVDNPRKSKEIQQKIQNTLIEKYGVDCPFLIPEIKEKLTQTWIDRYGTAKLGKSKEIHEKAKQTCMLKYGTPYYMQTDEFKQKVYEKTQSSPSYCVSKTNKKYAELFNSMGIETTFEYPLENYRYDIFILSKNILIEIDSSYIHSMQPNHFGYKCNKDYHKIKTDIACKHGFRCIHIFDWDDPKKICQLVCDIKQRYYARNLSVEYISSDAADKFFELYHIQGKVTSQLVSVALIDKEELISVMSFGIPRYSKKYEWEILRYAAVPDKSIVGGTEKLFSCFLKDFTPESVISYCDIAKFTGKMYERLGFSLDHISSPNKVWSKGTKKITDNLLRQRGFDQLFGTNYGKG
ncbi:MAG: hypothetical protein LUC17_01985, partial [Oscillospiraceae bacterium]|nr:hypothetical protein [Oscillospiraceae bacterium]